MEQKKSKKKLGKILYYVLLIIFALIFIGSAIYIGQYIWGSIQAAEEYGHLQDLYVPPSRPPITQGTEGTGGTEGTEPPATGETGVTEPQDPAILPELQVFYESNKHVVGWISVPNTKINYPVLQSPERPDYYLNHTYEGKWSAWGAIYVRESCDVFKPSDNITIYGHHMKDGSMFTGLDNYRQKSFWEANQYIYFDTLYERHTYQVIGAFRTSANYGEGFPYHLYEDFASQEEFDDFLSAVKELSREYYANDVPAVFGDKFITLSTCEYTLDNGRFVVVAKRVA